MKIKEISKRIEALARSSQGRNAFVFFIFLLISTILWSVMTLNEEVQCDVRMPVELRQVPDSVTMINLPPSMLSVSLRTKGTQRIRLALTSAPTLNIDFRAYRSRGTLHLDPAELTALTRNALGNATVLLVSPDSINVTYTTQPGRRLPVKLDCNVTTSPQCIIKGRPRLSVDSVKVYSAGSLPHRITSISTEPVTIADVNQSMSRKVKLVAPRGCRVIPDSVDVIVDVEPLIMKTRKIVIEPVNVPRNIKLITFPAQVDVMYMMPMSVYKNSDPQLRVVADYHTLGDLNTTTKIKLRLLDVPDVLRNVHLLTDSAEYIIEHL